MIIQPYNHALFGQIAIDMGADMHAASQYAHLPYSYVATEKLSKQIDQRTLAGWLAFCDNKPAGMLIVSLSDYFFCEGKTVSDLLVYVKPEYRHTSAFYRLVRSAEEWAKRQGASSIVYGITAAHNPDVTARAYRKLGYLDRGIYLAKEL